MPGTYVQVLGGPVNGPLYVVTNSSGRGVFSLTEPVFFDAGIGIVAGVTPQSPGIFQIRAWRGALTWDEAQRNPDAFLGESPLFQNPTGFYSGHNYSLVPFVALSPVLAPNRPRLRISAQSSGITLIWPTNYRSYVLEQTHSLSPAAWDLISEDPAVVGSDFSKAANVNESERFYRLRKR